MGGVWVVRVVRALTSNQCGPGSNPGVDAMYGSVKFVNGILFCSQVFLPLFLHTTSKAKEKCPGDEVVLNSNSTRNQVSKELLSTRY